MVFLDHHHGCFKPRFPAFKQKNYILNYPTLIDNILLVVVNADISNSFIRFFSGFLSDICEFTP